MTPSAASLPSPGTMYYRHSGRFWPLGVLGALVVSVLAAAALGAAYAYVDLYNPCVSVVTFLATGAFAFAVGGVTALALRVGRVRNNVVVALVAALAALAALYASWIVWLYALLMKSGETEVTLGALVTHPRAVWHLILLINEHGAWSMGGHPGSKGSETPVKGTFLWVVWAAEALAVVGIATVVGARFSLSTPYCERCDRWCVGRTGVATTDAAAIDPPRLRQLMERGDFAQLAALGPARTETGQWLRFDLHECPRCNAVHVVTANRVRLQVNKKGQQSQSATPLVKQLLITPQAAEAIRALGKPVAAAPVEATAVAAAAPTETAVPLPLPLPPPPPLLPPPTFGPPVEAPPTEQPPPDEPPRLGI